MSPSYLLLLFVASASAFTAGQCAVPASPVVASRTTAVTAQLFGGSTKSKAPPTKKSGFFGSVKPTKNVRKAVGSKKKATGKQESGGLPSLPAYQYGDSVASTVCRASERVRASRLLPDNGGFMGVGLHERRVSVTDLMFAT